MFFYSPESSKSNREKPMLTRWIKRFVIKYFHSILHRIPLYYETAKESSKNIKKMAVTGRMTVIIFYFKNIFQFENLMPSQEVVNG
jgi:hypothetical protein